MEIKKQTPLPIDPGLPVAILLALFAALPLLTHAGLPNTADGPAHLMRQVELNRAWQDGILYPRWAPDLALGHGMPLFNYAPPLLYFVTQLLHLTGLALDASMKGSVIAAMMLYPAGMYLFARELFGGRGGLLAAAVYLYAPYRLREAYIQGNYGQFWGLAFYPLILWAFHRLVTTGRRRHIPAAALALAGLLLSHNISAMLFAPLFGLYLLLLIVKKGPSGRPGLAAVGAAIALGLGLSAFFWLPAFGEQGLIRLAGITRGFFDFRRNFITLPELLALPRPLDLSAINPYFPLGLGPAQIWLAAGGAALLLTARRRASGGALGRRWPEFSVRPVIFFGAGLLGYGFMALPQSQPVWEALPLVALAEFPWRMFGPAVLCAAVLAGGGVRALEQGWGQRAANRGLGVGLALTIAANLFYLVPNQFIVWGTPTPADAVAYEAETGATGTTSAGEFLPRWAERPPAPQTLGPDYAAGRLPATLNPASLPAGAAARTTRHTARQTRIAVTAPAPFRATFRTLYWPEWDISLWQNGERQKTYPAAEVAITRPGGLLQAQLPAGEYEIRLERRATPIRRAATVLSAASLAALAGLVWFGRRRRGSGRTAPAPAPAFSRRQAIIIGGAIVLGALGVQAAAGRLRVQSPPDVAFGAQHALRVDFGDAIRLLGADLPPAVVSPGQTVAATAYWRALRPLADDYAVFLHLDAPDGQTVAAAGEQHPANIPTSHWPPGLYLRHPLQLTIPPGALPVRYTLRVGLYNPQSGVRLPVAGDSQTAFAVGQVWVRPAAAPAVPPGPRARFGESIQLLGARFDEPAQTVTLYWQTDAPLPTGYSIFLHQLDAGGTVVGQADGAPFGNLYALSDWRPGQVVADARPLGGSAVRRLLVGVYSPASGERLPAVDNAGHPLPGNALLIEVPAQPR